MNRPYRTLTPSRRRRPVRRVVALLPMLLVGSFAMTTSAQAITRTFVVNSLDDDADNAVGNGVCETATANECTLRAAIEEANATTDADRIHFDLTMPSPWVINVVDGLPAITAPVTIDGTTQDGWTADPVVEVRGEVDGDNGIVFDAAADHSVVKGLAITNFGVAGVGINANSNFNRVESNWIGLDLAGVAAPNGIGVVVAGNQNVIGSSTGPRTQVVSGNDFADIAVSDGSGNTVAGNLIGTDPTGELDADADAESVGVFLGAATDGGTVVDNNVVSGHPGAGLSGVGISVQGSFAKITNNLVGVDATNDAPIPNRIGIHVVASATNEISGNVVSGNTSHGIELALAADNLLRDNTIGNSTFGNGGHGLHVDRSSANRIEGGIVTNNGGGGVVIVQGDNNVVAGLEISDNDLDGVRLEEKPPPAPNGAVGNRIGGSNPGEGNTITGNGNDGVAVVGNDSVGNQIVGNSIYDNGDVPADLGIDLLSGSANTPDGPNTGQNMDPQVRPNRGQNFPTFDFVNPVTDTVQFDLQNTVPNARFRVEIFRSDTCDPSGFGEGQELLAAVEVNTGGGGNANNQVVAIPAGLVKDDAITATATRISTGDTSEFSPCALVPNQPPVADDDSYSTGHDETLIVPAPGVLVNDSDPDGDSLTATNFTALDPAGAGTLTPNANGGFTFDPAVGFSGDATFTYTADDGTGAVSAPATVTITVAANQAPVADDDSYSTDESVVLEVDAANGVLSNDSDPDPDPDTLTAVLATGVPAGQGTLTLNPDGSFTYDPGTFGGPSTSFTYQAQDEFGAVSAPATVTITVVPNVAPVANDDFYTVENDTTLTVNAANGVLANDEDPDAGPEDLRVTNASPITGPDHGELVLNANGSFVYTPDPGFIGEDSFTYRARDGLDNSNLATVTITVAPGAGDFLFAIEDGTDAPAVGGGEVELENEDVVLYDSSEDAYSIYFDGSDMGISSLHIDALAKLPSGDLVMSFTNSGTVPGVGTVDDSDLVRFHPTSLGEENTDGTFHMYFDGSDIGLTSSDEDIDAIEIAGGDLYISTSGDFSVAGASGHDEDLLRCTNATTGANSACPGGRTRVFDGSDAGMGSSGEDADAFSFMGGANSDALWSTTGSFSVPGLSGDNEDVFGCNSLADCDDFTMVFNGSRHELTEDLDAIEFNL